MSHKLITALVLSISVVACGGGGGGRHHRRPSLVAAQDLALARDPVQAEAGAPMLAGLMRRCSSLKRSLRVTTTGTTS